MNQKTTGDKQLGFAVEDGMLRYDGWAEKLEKEIAIILMPKLDSKFSPDEHRLLAARLAMLAARRARDAKVLVDEAALVKCRGCDAQIVAQTAVCLCESCGKNVRSAGSDG
jgi:hypothetical protein